MNQWEETAARNQLEVATMVWVNDGEVRDHGDISCILHQIT